MMAYLDLVSEFLGLQCLLILSPFLDYRSDLKPTDIAEEFDRMWEMWARGIPYHGEKESGKSTNCLQVTSLESDN